MAKRFRKHLRHLKKEGGQSIVILAFAFIGLVAMLGLALDLGLAYIERVALKRAIDAAVLGGVIELPLEEDAGRRAMEYLSLNGYDLSETIVFFQGCVRDKDSGAIDNKETADEYVFIGPDMSVADAQVDPSIRNIFWIDTLTYQGDDLGVVEICNEANGLYGTANKLRVSGEVKVDMNFMQLVPPFIPYVTVAEEGVAQNVDNLDIVVVLDRSGSMEFDPVCYGCWERTENPQEPNPSGDPLRWADFFTYPSNGDIYPIGYNDGDDTDGGFKHPGVQNVCTDPADLDDLVYRNGGYYYLIMEAELYSVNNSVVETDLRETGKGYWAMQRGGGNYGNETNPILASSGSSVDGKGAHMAHHPIFTFYPTESQPYGRHYTLQQAEIDDAPGLVYDFKFRNDGPSTNWVDGQNAYIWVRVQASRRTDSNIYYYSGWNPPWLGGDNSGSDANGTWLVKAYWKVDTDSGSFTQAATEMPYYTPGHYRWQGYWANRWGDVQPPNNTGFQWVRLNNPITINTGDTYHFTYYAGSSGIAIDQVLVTNNPGNLPDNPFRRDTFPYTPPATPGSAYRAACDPCNAIFGEDILYSDTPPPADGWPPYYTNECTFFTYNQPVNQATDPIFDEWENPMRTSKEAIKLFISNLDPERDQVGLVTYSHHTGNPSDPRPTKTELTCLRRDGVSSCATPSISFTQVLKDVESVNAGGGTNTGYGMKSGLEVLGVDLYDVQNPGPNACGGGTPTDCSRGAGAQRIMILLTDGVPNFNPGGACENGGPTWEGEIDPTETDNQDDHDCPLYFAQQASQRGVTVYVIGLGFGVNRDYLKEVAAYGRGNAYFSATGADLNIIFSEILNNIFVRLIK